MDDNERIAYIGTLVMVAFLIFCMTLYYLQVDNNKLEVLKITSGIVEVTE